MLHWLYWLYWLFLSPLGLQTASEPLRLRRSQDSVCAEQAVGGRSPRESKVPQVSPGGDQAFHLGRVGQGTRPEGWRRADQYFPG